MPAKKKTAKKVAAKTEAKEIVETLNEFHPATASKEDRELYAAHLEQLKVTGGWLILSKIMDDNIALLAEKIVNKVDENGEPLTDQAVDELRIQYNQIKQLRDMPNMLIDKFRPSEAAPDVQYDPYSGSGLSSNVLSMSDTT